MNIQPHLIAATILTAVFITSCTENIDNSQEQNANGKLPITFTIDDSQDWNQKDTDEIMTRAIGKSVVKSNTTAMTTDDGCLSGLFIHASTTDGVNNTQFKLEKSTRGEAKTDLQESFNVIAYEYGNNEIWGNQPVSWTDVAAYNAGKWSMNERYWPTGTNVTRFVGYAPTDMPNLIVPAIGDTGEPRMTLTVPTAISNQKDLMVAFTGPTTFGTEGGKAYLHFKHALTCVKFAVGEYLNAGDEIKSIILRKIAKTGTLTIGNSLTWNADADSRDDFFMTDINFNVLGSNTGAIIAPSGSNGELQTTMLMIPQTFIDDEQQIEMSIKKVSDGQVHKVAASLKNSAWLPGTTVTYKLSTTPTSGTFVLTASSVSVGHNGGQSFFTVTSYEEKSNNKTALPWEIIGYSTNDGVSFSYEKPASLNWLGITTTSGSGGVDGQKCIINIAASNATQTSTPNDFVLAMKEILQKTYPKRGTEDCPYDLSTHDLAGNETACNTANCYVVNAPGWYKLPLVYGNGIKNDIKNEDAYSGTAINHADGTINDPYISYTPAEGNDGGILCWQDASGLVSDVAVSTDKKYLTFKVDSLSITPGNAVIAVRQDNADKDIMWSWHIWVTPIDINSTIEVNNPRGYRYDFLPTPLGWCPTNGTLKTYNPRTVLLMIRQSTGMTAVFRVTQTGGVELVSNTKGYAPYYQWGRKDPQLPWSTTSTYAFHDQFYDNSKYRWQTKTGPVYVNESIKYPYAFITTSNSNSNWCRTASNSWWDARGTTGITFDKAIKTIYDPSPVGFAMPPVGAFYTFTYDGEQKSAGSCPIINSSTANTDGGYSFRTFSGNNAIYFPRTGIIDNDGTKGTNVNGHYTTATPYDATSNYYFGYSIGGDISPKYKSGRVRSWAARSIAE